MVSQHVVNYCYTRRKGLSKNNRELINDKLSYVTLYSWKMVRTLVCLEIKHIDNVLFPENLLHFSFSSCAERYLGLRMTNIFIRKHFKNSHVPLSYMLEGCVFQRSSCSSTGI